MYFPPYEQLMRAAAKLMAAKPGESTVTVPTKLFNFILQAALTTVEFNEEAYLSANPDIRAGLESRRGLTAQQHFLLYGFFEGRRGGMVTVDEPWYLDTYPDVSEAVKRGTVMSAKEHFEVVGAVEGRIPAPEYGTVAAQWKALFKPE
jgi:hypothetical protein